MRAKPESPRYRNLTARGSVIYYHRRVGGRRIKLSCKTSSWEEAASFRDLYEAAKGIGTSVLHLDVSNFETMAKRFLREGTFHHAPSYQADLARMLGEGGLILRYLGKRPLDEITKADLVGFWTAEVEQTKRTTATGDNYIKAIALVFSHAVILDEIETSPVEGFRAVMRARRRTKRGRREARADHRCPIETPAQVEAFYEASRGRWSADIRRKREKRAAQRSHVADLLMLDAGLRAGEVGALRWEDLSAEGMLIRRSLSRGKYLGATKSGRERLLDVSHRLRLLLGEWRLVVGNPEAGVVLEEWDSQNHGARHFTRVLEKAKIGEHHTPKCLRDTFASQLLTCGVSIAYISRQLGHADVMTTLRHYAKWTDERYRRPLEVRDGEAPADLMARLAA